MKKYQFKTLKEITEVINPNNIDTFLSDFTLWLKLYIAVNTINGATLDNPDTMKWIDDNKPGIKQININIVK